MPGAATVVADMVMHCRIIGDMLVGMCGPHTMIASQAGDQQTKPTLANAVAEGVRRAKPGTSFTNICEKYVPLILTQVSPAHTCCFRHATPPMLRACARPVAG